GERVEGPSSGESQPTNTLPDDGFSIFLRHTQECMRYEGFVSNVASMTDDTHSQLGTFVTEVAVIGGGSAGLAAAIALARSRRTVVVIDGGEPRNAPATGAHNVLGQEGVPPLELLARGRSEAEAYGVRIVPG